MKQTTYKSLTQSLAHELLDYNSTTGVLTWRVRDIKHFKLARACVMWNNRYPGEKAGTIHRKKEHLTAYIRLSINKIGYEYHRVVFLYVHGWLPEQIDHIDGNGLNNRIENLKPVNAKINRKNMSRSIKNKTGCTGVFYWKERNVYKAYICINNKQCNLGCFKTFEEAKNVRLKEEIKLKFSKNHGRPHL